MKLSRWTLLSVVSLFISHQASAFFEGTFSLGFAAGITAADQGDMNELQSRANTREGGISTGQLGNAWEFAGIFQYRYSGSMLAIQLKPTYFFQSEDGKNAAGTSFEYGVSGWTIFPTAKFHMLESDTMKFYSQLAIGYGFASGTIKEEDASGSGNATVEFSGGDLGYLAGLGAEFCFTKSHCIMVEGNYRFLKISRVTSDKSSGTFDSDSISQSSGEVEYDNKDLSINLSGIQGYIGYVFHME